MSAHWSGLTRRIVDRDRLARTMQVIVHVPTSASMSIVMPMGATVAEPGALVSPAGYPQFLACELWVVDRGAAQLMCARAAVLRESLEVGRCAEFVIQSKTGRLLRKRTSAIRLMVGELDTRLRMRTDNTMYELVIDRAR